MKKAAALLLILLTLAPAASVFAADNAKVVKTTFFGFGPGYFSNLNTRAMATIFSYGMAWSIDPQFDIVGVVDFGFSFKHTDARYLVPQMKARYSFTEEANHTWFAGAGMGVGYARNHDTFGFPPDSVTGLSASVAFGFKAFRKSAMPIIIEFEHQMILEESRYGTPIMTSLKFGVFFP